MARPLFPAQPGRGPIERQCPIRVVSVHLLSTAGQLLRVLFLDREGHISGQPHLMASSEALILAANMRLATRSVAAMAPAAISLDERSLAPLEQATIQHLQDTIRSVPRPVVEGFTKALSKRFQGAAGGAFNR
jgi:hypothetical protein